MSTIKRKMYIIVEPGTANVLCGHKENKRFKNRDHLNGSIICIYTSRRRAAGALNHVFIANAKYDENDLPIAEIKEVEETITIDD